MKKTLTSVALVAGCAMALAVPALQAQTMNSQTKMNLGHFNDTREWRILHECSPLTVAHLRTGCIDTVNIEEDQRTRSLDGQRTRTLNEGLTGGGHGRMNPIDRTFQGPEEYDPHFGR